MKVTALTKDGLPFVIWPEAARIETHGQDTAVLFPDGQYVLVSGLPVATEGDPLPITGTIRPTTSSISMVGDINRMFWNHS